MNVEQMEQRFHALKKQLETGKIDDEQFVTEVEKLQFRDEQERLWMIGVSTGQWSYKEGDDWVQGDPPEPPLDEPLPFPFSRKVLLLIGGILIVSVLIIVGIWAGRELILEPVTPTVVVLMTGTATPLPTETPTQMPTNTPSSTTSPSKVPTDTPSLIPTATATFTSIPIDTPTPTPMPTNTPIATVPPPSDDTTPSIPKPTIAGKIAFPVFDTGRGTYHIFIANADGTDRKKIKEEASQPCLSSDGSEITYRSWRSDKRGLVVAHTFGDDIWTLTPRHEASRPSVSKAGTAYHCKEPDRPAHIYLHRDSGEPQVIRYGNQQQPISGESTAWVSGERLVYKGCAGTTCGLYLTDGVYNGTGLTQLTDDTSDTNPEASPDGKEVVFMSRRDGNWEIYVMENLVANGPVKRLTNNVANDGLPIWSPDGQTIAFASDQSGEWAIWAMNPDGSNQRMLFPLVGSPHGDVRDAPLHERGGWEEERLSWVP